MAVSKIAAAAKGAVQGVIAWLDLAITLIEKLGMFGLVLILFGIVSQAFDIPLWLPAMDPYKFAALALAWSVLQGKIRIDKFFDGK